MDTLISYIIKSLITSGILYIYYLLALRNKRFHTYNRFYLLMAVLISLLLPVMNFRWYHIEGGQNTPLKTIIAIISPSHIRQPTFHFTINWLVFYSMAMVSIILLIILLSKIVWIYKLKQKYKNIRMYGYNLIETDVKQAPFSFLNNLFWKQGISVTDVNGEKIFKHELAHIKQYHTYDKLFTQIVLCVYWINPFYWLLQKELNMIHEFIADAESIKKGDTKSFALMLLQSHNEGRYLNPSHPFFHSPIKRRLIMITSSKKTSYSYLRRVLILPLIVLVIMLFSLSVVKAQNDPRLNPGPVNVQKVTIKKTSDSVANVRIDYLNTENTPATLNLSAKYSNKDSLKEKNEKKAIIYDGESGGKREISAAEVRDFVSQTIKNPPADNIFFLNGKEVSKEEIYKLDPLKVKTANVFHGKEAIVKYGDKARNGVILFTTE